MSEPFDPRPQENPWVLIRKGKPPLRFASLDRARRFFDQLRFNAANGIMSGTVFGPGGEAWYCAGTRWGRWQRDDDRRKRKPEAEETAV